MNYTNFDRLLDEAIAAYETGKFAKALTLLWEARNLPNARNNSRFNTLQRLTAKCLAEREASARRG